MIAVVAALAETAALASALDPAVAAVAVAAAAASACALHQHQIVSVQK